MQEEVRQALLAHPELFHLSRRVYHGEDLALCYRIYNLHYGENRMDSGCGSCRRSVINHLKKLYNDLTKQ
jgi:hypothetical protein